jgi:hypothetical protein
MPEKRRIIMADELKDKSTAESLRATRTYGKVRCHNQSCMERLEPKKGDTTVKCASCGCEYRIAWLKDGWPHIRGPVWDVNRKIAEEAFAKRMAEKKE